MPRDTRLTLWPEQMAYYPLTNSWAEIKNTSTLDLSYCNGVHSCGLAATILNLHWLFNSLYPSNDNIGDRKPKQLSMLPEHDKIVKIYKHKNHDIMDHCLALGFFECIKKRLSDKNREKYCFNEQIEPIRTNYFSLNTLSYPVYHFNFDKFPIKKRDILDDFFCYTEPIFDSIFKKNQDRGNQLNHVLEEIVKNIADHSGADGFMGMDVVFSEKISKLSILIGDLGPGIYNHYGNSKIATVPGRKDKMGFAEGYQWALTNGNSGSNNPENDGCGMSSIVNGCIGLKCHLSVFDVFSRLVLSSLPPIDQEPVSHNDIWRISFRFDGKKPFFYFIQCEETIS